VVRALGQFCLELTLVSLFAWITRVSRGVWLMELEKGGGHRCT
jgi:hypothetical protein